MRVILLLFVFVVVTHVVYSNVWTAHRRTKRETKCYCSPNLHCALKFQTVKGHTACLNNATNAKPIHLSGADKDEIVNLHNTYRGQVSPPATDMLKMYWDDEVAMIAQKWSDACKVDRGGAFYHDKYRHVPARFSVGQNIGSGYSTNQAAIDAWYAEESNYQYGVKISSFDPSKPVGHYTQLVWAASHKIGCGLTECDGKRFFVCNYAPAGNVFPFSQPYTKDTGGQCSQPQCQNCVSGLCDCGDKTCEMGGILKPSTCSCDCGNSAGKGPFCKLNCNSTDLPHCGTQDGFRSSNCPSAYMSNQCPQVCGLCPCADPNYKIPECNGGATWTSGVTLCLGIIFVLLAHGLGLYGGL